MTQDYLEQRLREYYSGLAAYQFPKRKWWDRFIPTWLWRLWYRRKRALITDEYSYTGEPIITSIHSYSVEGDEALEVMGLKGTWVEDVLKELPPSKSAGEPNG